MEQVQKNPKQNIQAQQYIKSIIHNNQVGFIPEM